MSMIYPLRLFQWGKETTRGTAVAATSKIAVENIEFTPLDEMYRPSLAKGYILPHSGDEVAIRRGTEWSVSDTPVIYNQMQHWLAMAVKGGVTAVGGADPYTWTFTRSLTADPVPDTWTLERRLTDGSNHVDYEWAYCFLTELTYLYEHGQPLKFSAKGVARRRQGSTLTAAMAMPTIGIPPAALGKVWMDATWAGLGTTLVSGMLQKAEWTLKTGLMPVALLDGRTDLDFSNYVVNGGEVGIALKLDLLVSKARFDTELTAAEAGTLRAVRLLVDDATANRSLQIDMLVKHVKASSFSAAESEGQVLASYEMQEATDGTNLLSIIAENGVNVYT